MDEPPVMRLSFYIMKEGRGKGAGRVSVGLTDVERRRSASGRRGQGLGTVTDT